MSDKSAFRLISKENLKEFNGALSVYEHVKSKATLVHIGDDNPQKLFMIGFRTLPGDDTGIAHIMEHSVLCGSKKYPVKEPFVELMKGSLNTFLNAMTGEDFTAYPVMSPNLKDFYNLMDVYLDAVLNPRIYEKPEILMQEGWHYELDEAGALAINGVVYNEMKGGMSSPEQQLEEAVNKTLFNNFYRYNAGGAPAAIPGLTQAQFEAFHKKFYHPGNSCTVISGDMPIEPVLDYIDEKYFSRYDAPESPVVMEGQAPLAAPGDAAFTYAVPEEQDTAGMTYLAANYLTYPAAGREEALGVMALAQMLFGSEAAPVKKALLDAEIGKDVSTNVRHAYQGVLKIVVSGAEEDGMAKFRAVLEETLRRLVREGLDKKLVEGAINRFDFGLREASFAGIFSRIMSGIYVLWDWNYGAKIGSGARYEAELAALREKAGQGYFEKLIEKYLLDNRSCAFVALKPERGKLAKLEAAEKERLAGVKAGMGEAQVSQVRDSFASLRAWQQTPDSPEALAAIPRLTLADVDKKATPRPVEQSEKEGVKRLWHDTFTAGIAYVNAMFDMSGLTPEEWKAAALLAFMFDKLGTQKRTFEELAKDIDVSTGGISAECKVIRRKNKGVYPYFCATLRCVGDKLPAGMELLSDIFTGADVNNRARLNQLSRTAYAMLQTQLQDNAYHYVIYRNRAYFRPEGAFMDATQGFGFYDYVTKTAKSLPEGADALAKALASVMEKLLTRVNLTLALTGQETQRDAFDGALGTLTQGLRDGESAGEILAFSENIRNEGIMSASMVQYVCTAYDFDKLGFAYDGKLLAVKNFLRSGYLWNNVRVQGGAYGAHILLTDDGVLSLSSFRDPNLGETLKIFRGAGEHLRARGYTQGDVENNVISAVADLDEPLPPFEQGNLAFKQHIAGITAADKQRERDELLSATVDDFAASGALFDAVAEKNCICVFGNADKLRANKELFGSLVKAEE